MHPINPIFLLGPGRSGTTLLYKILALHSEVGFISNYDERLPSFVPSAWFSRLFSHNLAIKQWVWFNESGNAYLAPRPWSKKLVPSPVEGESIFARAGLTRDEYETAAPEPIPGNLRRALIRLQKYQGAKALVVKRTTNNRRIPCLAAAFPEAKYIFLIRDGRSVAASLRQVRWWNDHSLWWANNQTPAQLQSAGMDMLSIAARNWVEEMRCIRAGIQGIRPENILKIRYEEVLSNPLDQIHAILRFMDVAPSSEHDAAVAKLGLRYRPESWSKWPNADLDTVVNIQNDYLRMFNYI